MLRKDLINSTAYWHTQLQISIFEAVTEAMKIDDIRYTPSAFNMEFGTTTMHQIKRGDFNGTIDVFVNVMLYCGKVPDIKVINLTDYIKKDMELNPECYV